MPVIPAPKPAAHCRESLNLIFSSTNVHRPHWCANREYLLITEHDEEHSACSCAGLVPSHTNAAILRPAVTPLPF